VKNYIQQKQKNLQDSQSSFYTTHGIHVYLQQPVEGINLNKVFYDLEEKMPKHFLDEVEMVIFGWFDEFEERDLEAFYQDGALYVSCFQENQKDLLENLIHEISHAVESAYGYEIYGDEKIKKEFLRKRKHLYDILWELDYKIPFSVFAQIEYEQDFDDLLYKKIGYDKLDQIVAGLFINSYAATSLREYFATAFTDFYMDDNHNFLKKVSPAAYEKIASLQQL
tara:strand:+ start:1654 stop:2325 length:672 start_codon:yes stop_codon:yes gene_type:complete